MQAEERAGTITANFTMAVADGPTSFLLILQVRYIQLGILCMKIIEMSMISIRYSSAIAIFNFNVRKGGGGGGFPLL